MLPDQMQLMQVIGALCCSSAMTGASALPAFCCKHNRHSPRVFVNECLGNFYCYKRSAGNGMYGSPFGTCFDRNIARVSVLAIISLLYTALCSASGSYLSSLKPSSTVKLTLSHAWTWAIYRYVVGSARESPVVGSEGHEAGSRAHVMLASCIAMA